MLSCVKESIYSLPKEQKNKINKKNHSSNEWSISVNQKKIYVEKEIMFCWIDWITE